MIDILSKQTHFTIENSFKFKITLGGILYLINLLLNGILFYFMFIDFILGNDITYSSYISNPTNLNDYQFNFIFSIEKKYSDSILIFSFNTNNYTFNYFSNKCTSNEISLFYNNSNDSLIYYCLNNLYDNILLFPCNSITQVFIYNHYNFNINNCLNEENIEIISNFAFIYGVFNSSSKDKYFIEKVFYGTTSNSSLYIYFDYDNLVIDTGWFYTNTNKFIFYDYIQTLIYHSYPPNFINYVLYLNNNHYINGTNKKLQNILAQYISLTKLIYIFLSIIYTFFFEYYYKKYILYLMIEIIIHLIIQK